MDNGFVNPMEFDNIDDFIKAALHAKQYFSVAFLFFCVIIAQVGGNRQAVLGITCFNKTKEN